jgi:hypothetical protein
MDRQAVAVPFCLDPRVDVSALRVGTVSAHPCQESRDHARALCEIGSARIGVSPQRYAIPTSHVRSMAVSKFMRFSDDYDVVAKLSANDGLRAL